MIQKKKKIFFFSFYDYMKKYYTFFLTLFMIKRYKNCKSKNKVFFIDFYT